MIPSAIQNHGSATFIERTSRSLNGHHDLFAGAGEVRALCRAFDWKNTPLGSPERWSPTIRAIVRATLDSPFPINLWIGPERRLIYNDAYVHVLGSKHPASLGRPGKQVWSEIWHDIEAMFEQIESGGPPVYADDAAFLVERADGQSRAWFTFALSAVRDEKTAS